MLALEAELLHMTSAVEVQVLAEGEDDTNDSTHSFFTSSAELGLKDVSRDLFDCGGGSDKPQPHAYEAILPKTVFSKRCAIAHAQYLREEAEGCSSCSNSSCSDLSFLCPMSHTVR